MPKNKHKIKENRLIKKTTLIAELKKAGINRTNTDALNSLEKYLTKHLKDLMLMLKEEIQVNGRKTLLKQNVKNVLNKLDKSKKDGMGWEV